MKACRLKDVKKFMGRLLGTDTFAPFLLAEAVITTYNTFVIDGHMVKEFFTGDIHDDGVLPPYEFSQWTDMRSLCFDLIKGKRTPVNFKLTLHLKPELVSEILASGDTLVTLSDLKAFVLNIKYDGNDLTCVTATAFHTFIPDKMPDQIWDGYMDQFMGNNGIGYEP